MLNGTLTLHDIRDTEAFCNHLIHNSHLDLQPRDRDDLLAYLISEAWRLSETYDHGNPKYPSRFSVIATDRLRKRITDWLRTNLTDRRYPSNHVTLEPLDDQLAGTLTGSPLDDPAHRSPDLQRALLRPHRHDTRPQQTHHQQAHDAAA